jgi:hypothetical protein
VDPIIQDFISRIAHDLVGLDLALFFQANPDTFDTAAGLSLHLHHRAEEIQHALDRLVAAGLLESTTRGEPVYKVYGLPSDPAVWRLICAVSEAYLDSPDTRKEIVRMLVRQRVEDANPEASPEGLSPPRGA